jgi:hypothetical protein
MVSPAYARKDAVVLPDAVDAEVADGVALLAEAVLLEDADRARVAGHHRRLDAMQAEVAEGEVHHDAHGLRGQALSVPALGDRVAEIGVLEDAAEDLAERDPADELGVEKDAEGMAAVGERLGGGRLSMSAAWASRVKKSSSRAGSQCSRNSRFSCMYASRAGASSAVR